MTCDETRELLSPYLDEALAPDERSLVDAHLEGCADCRRELEALRGTVALLHRVEPARAPVGFVDRVVAAAQPRPWYRRAADAVLLPMSVKLPLEAAAVVMVGLLAVYLFERSPELQRAAREVDRGREAAAPAPAKEKPTELLGDKAPAAAPSTPAPVEEPGRAPGARDRADASRSQDANPLPAVPAPSPSRPPGSPPVSPPPAVSSPSAGSPPPPAAAPAQEAKPLSKTEAPSENVAGSARPEAESRQRTLETAEDSARAAGASAKLGARKAVPPADVVARVAVKDRDAAERELTALIERLGGGVTQRRREDEATVVEAVIPQPRYAEFSESLKRIGSWRVEAERPDLPAQIRVVLRLQ